ncbi:exonuclease, DNA polymerase III, epsilon subunit [Eubacterium sp. 14-2]|uniref:3'-5' exonuclease n=1 Tax=Eubacterium sp. 14-2 TaxID=1235790 RepID=UPI0003386464|nr:3'-5' exonuclease [Eubacterium sp. 14-2]EOT23476.1 exonuclease, DNA polymerase III, epsilon subunit [Eubacterium sp. 14-2]
MPESYVVVDLEMTGLQARTDRILEIGAVKVEKGREDQVFHRMVNPHMELSEEIIKLTGITGEMAQKGCETEEAVKEFQEFSEGLPLVGHNILFDYSFLKQYIVNYGGTFEKEGIDTLKLARKFLPEAEKKTLDYLCEFLGIFREQNHRALEDAKAAAELFRYLQERFEFQEPEAFWPKPLQYKVKRQGPASPRQKKRLEELARWHNIELQVELDSLTRNEASRITDRILAAYGKIPR